MNEQVAEAFSEVMRDAMESRGMDKEALYDAIYDVPGLNYCMMDINWYLEGTNLPPLDIALAMASALDIDLDALKEYVSGYITR